MSSPTLQHSSSATMPRNTSAQIMSRYGPLLRSFTLTSRATTRRCMPPRQLAHPARTPTSSASHAPHLWWRRGHLPISLVGQRACSCGHQVAGACHDLQCLNRARTTAAPAQGQPAARAAAPPIHVDSVAVDTAATQRPVGWIASARTQRVMTICADAHQQGSALAAATLLLRSRTCTTTKEGEPPRVPPRVQVGAGLSLEHDGDDRDLG